MPSTSNHPIDPEGPTGKLCTWIDSLSMSSIPEETKTRAKYLLLDGVACALVGAHLPWSEKATNVVLDMEPAGDCAVFGWDKVRSHFHPSSILLTSKEQNAYNNTETSAFISSPNK
jgi:aconitate decarboxylase